MNTNCWKEVYVTGCVSGCHMSAEKQLFKVFDILKEDFFLNDMSRATSSIYSIYCDRHRLIVLREYRLLLESRISFVRIILTKYYERRKCCRAVTCEHFSTKMVAKQSMCLYNNDKEQMR